MTDLERFVADFFINVDFNSVQDFSAENIMKLLNVSGSTLTRFSQKCGFKGYREFIYMYELSYKNTETVNYDALTLSVVDNYKLLLDKIYSLIDERQIQKIVKKMYQSEYLYFYGKGSSGLVANEMKIRFMRMGIKCEAITDDHIMKMNHTLVDKNSMVFGFSISGKTEVVLSSLNKAKRKNSFTVLMTSQKQSFFDEYIDELILVSNIKNLEFGNQISPQFPLLVMVDLIFTHYLNQNKELNDNLYLNTVESVNNKKELIDGQKRLFKPNQ